MATMGRPKSENPKNMTVTIRLTPEKHKEIADYSKLHEQTISKTMIEGFELLKKKQE